ncbi:MAG: hypothetical protein U0804_05685 [Gemmataceae bacterium]
MSFYSSLVLAANADVRAPQLGEVRDLLAGLGLIDAADSGPQDFSASDAVAALFRDAQARAENNRFFFPSAFSLSPDIEVNGPDDLYTGPGWSLHLHGNGYFYPWGLTELRDRVVRSPVLVGLRAAMAARFGGRFVFPTAGSELLRPRVIDGDDSGWVWLPSEDVY